MTNSSNFISNKIFTPCNRCLNNGNAQEVAPVCSESSNESKTIYKTVDFAKTIALKETKRDIESEREQAISDHSTNHTNMFSTLTGSNVLGSIGANILLNR